MSSATDIVVIGGGIAGCATAWFLARRKVRVLLLEKEATLAAEQSGRALGFVRQQGRHFLEIPMAMESLRLWVEISGELGIDTEFVRGGVMMLAETERDEQLLSLEADQAKAFGYGAHMIGAQQIARILPRIAGSWRSALWSPDDGSTSPPKSTRAFAEAAQRLGAEVRCSTAVTGLDIEGGRIRGVRVGDELIKASAVVCAAGVWSTQIAAMAGVTLPLQVVRTSLAETAETNVDTQVAVFTPYVSYRPTRQNTWWIGGGYRGAGVDYDFTVSSLRHFGYFGKRFMQNWRNIRIGVGETFLSDMQRAVSRGARRFQVAEPRANDAIIEHNVAQFRKLLPDQADVAIARRWAGRVDLTPDLVPAIGPTRKVEGLCFATGLSGHGIVLGPVIGKLASEAVLDGRMSIDVSALRPDRFAEGELAPPSATPEFFYSEKTKKGGHDARPK